MIHHGLAGSELWDRRAWALQVIDATGSLVRVRALVSAADSSAQWELRCEVREGLVTWLQRRHPEALPRVRTDIRAYGDGAGVLPAQRLVSRDAASVTSDADDTPLDAGIAGGVTSSQQHHGTLAAPIRD